MKKDKIYFGLGSLVIVALLGTLLFVFGEELTPVYIASTIMLMVTAVLPYLGYVLKLDTDEKKGLTYTVLGCLFVANFVAYICFICLDNIPMKTFAIYTAAAHCLALAIELGGLAIVSRPKKEEE